jgi:DNA-binding SARP family transcriptional activator
MLLDAGFAPDVFAGGMMAHLSLSFLGPFQVTLGGEPVIRFKSNKVRALFAYLAVEADRPHRRESLAGLLWPEWPDRDALSNLRYSLSNLRRVIGDARTDPSYLLISRDTLQFNRNSDYQLDVTAFTDLLASGPSQTGDGQDLAGLEQAIGLYRGPFLEGFSVRDSDAFEEWTQMKRRQMEQQLLATLRYLATWYEGRREYESAVAWARRQIELEPWDETSQQQLIRMLALSGQRSAALVQYESCCRLLMDDLGVEPAAETRALYEQIRSGELRASSRPLPTPPDTAASPPPFLQEELVPVERPVFVARESELAQLHSFLELALAGQGRVAFVTGEAGSGKTTLVQEFGRQAQQRYAELSVAGGNCNAYTGIGDPYLPFREILELLTGDVEAKWAAGAINSEHARRLWNGLPDAAQALIEVGQGLIGTFISTHALRERGSASTPLPGQAAWLARLDDIVENAPDNGRGIPSPQRGDLFEQYTRVMAALAQRGPLLLLLDDLQWADAGSISMLFHLGRHLAGCRILIVGAFRPEEVAIGREGERHPLTPVVREFQRDFGEIVVNVDQAEHRQFVGALLNSEPNRLKPGFREMLYLQTRGQPLFTIELLRGMQDRGDLIQDAEGLWVEGKALDWETLPARVEAAIAERVGRLPGATKAVLRVASVEGENFTAEIVGRVLGSDERDVVRLLSGQLDRRHRLVRAQGVKRFGQQRVSRYRFRNYLFQKYLYDSLDDVERAYLHEDVGNMLEQLYESQPGEIATISPELARHFQEAGITEKSIRYLHQAGDRAVQLSAYQEGIAHLNRALELLLGQPDSPERAQKELALQLSLGMAWMAHLPGPEWLKAHTRARELCRQTGDLSQLCRIVGRLSIRHFVRAEYQKAHELGEEALSLAQQVGEPLLVALARWQLGFISFGQGEYSESRALLQQVISFYQPEQHHQLFLLQHGSDAGMSALAFDACCLWCLGFPEQALKRSQQALALARALDHPFSLADVLCYGGCVLNKMSKDAEAVMKHAAELERLSNEWVIPGWIDAGIRYQGQALAMQGNFQEAIVTMEAGVNASISRGLKLDLVGTLGSLAQALAKVGRLEQGLSRLEEALAKVEASGERHWEAELYRQRAELLLMQGDAAGAEASLETGIEVARRQRAKFWELRATIDLARLWGSQGRREEARQRLGQIYGWFTEGFDTPDLKEAKALLAELGSGE